MQNKCMQNSANVSIMYGACNNKCYDCTFWGNISRYLNINRSKICQKCHEFVCKDFISKKNVCVMCLFSSKFDHCVLCKKFINITICHNCQKIIIKCELSCKNNEESYYMDYRLCSTCYSKR